MAPEAVTIRLDAAAGEWLAAQEATFLAEPALVAAGYRLVRFAVDDPVRRPEGASAAAAPVPGVARPRRQVVGAGWRFAGREAVPAALRPHPLLTVPWPDDPSGAATLVPLVQGLTLPGCPAVAELLWRPGWPDLRLNLVGLERGPRVGDVDRLHREATALFLRREVVGRPAGAGVEEPATFLARLDTALAGLRRDRQPVTAAAVARRLGLDRSTLYDRLATLGLTWAAAKVRGTRGVSPT